MTSTRMKKNSGCVFSCYWESGSRGFAQLMDTSNKSITGFILTCNRTSVLIPGNPRESNTAGSRIRQIQLHRGVWTTCVEDRNHVEHRLWCIRSCPTVLSNAKIVNLKKNSTFQINWND